MRFTCGHTLRRFRIFCILFLLLGRVFLISHDTNGCSHDYWTGGAVILSFFCEQHGAGLGKREKETFGRHVCMMLWSGLETFSPYCTYVCQRNRLHISHGLNPPIPTHRLGGLQRACSRGPHGVSRIGALGPPLAKRAGPRCDDAMRPAYVKRIEFETLDRGGRLAKSRNTAPQRWWRVCRKAPHWWVRRAKVLPNGP